MHTRIPAIGDHLSRAALAGLVTVALAAVPGHAAAEGGAEQLPAYHVVSAPVLHAKPPRRVLPIAGSYRLTGRFGASSSHWHHGHTGLDFATAYGTPIHAVQGGTVVEAGYAGRYGNKTVVRLRNGTEFWYCHQSEIDVRVGQRVHAGEVIGEVGTTGNVTGPHLHLEVRPDGADPVDPEGWLARRSLRP